MGKEPRGFHERTLVGCADIEETAADEKPSDSTETEENSEKAEEKIQETLVAEEIVTLAAEVDSEEKREQTENVESSEEKTEE